MKSLFQFQTRAYDTTRQITELELDYLTVTEQRSNKNAENGTSTDACGQRGREKKTQSGGGGPSDSAAGEGQRGGLPGDRGPSGTRENASYAGWEGPTVEERVGLSEKNWSLTHPGSPGFLVKQTPFLIYPQKSKKTCFLMELMKVSFTN